jgi:hypothetical protein
MLPGAGAERCNSATLDDSFERLPVARRRHPRVTTTEDENTTGARHTQGKSSWEQYQRQSKVARRREVAIPPAGRILYRQFGILLRHFFLLKSLRMG